eukprot:TRINITY_DN4962_c0_g1_i1.p1 TRINITY_DN4962_c0_g1~~TRINITY_DN4962_c0_g1_i1.p1  ORF type:complete len:134 (-),score=56.28 TRINITY_DN4962_c0_g1_i1:216-617(-)
MGDEVIDEYGTLQLGKDFQEAQCMLNSEVYLLLSKRAEDFDENDEQPPVFDKTLKYVSRFNLYKGRSAVKEVRQLLLEKGLEQYELAAMANLCPEKVEEAKALIPSLQQRFDDDEIQGIINQLQAMRKYVSVE